MKAALRSLLRRMGFELKRFHPAYSDDARVMAALASHRIDLILDIGANAGQFGRWLRGCGYRGRIVSFEPLAAPREELSRASRGDPAWEVAPRMALGEAVGELQMHVAGNSVSSSLLTMLSTHARVAPESAYVATEPVPVRPLDEVAPAYLRDDSVLFIKIDTQGYEDRVLAGAPATLARAAGIQLELSLVPLYEGQSSYEELVAQLKAAGLSLWNLAPVLVDPSSGRLLQIDATFFRQ